MPKFIAFLRAINVGGHTVKMDALRQLFSDQGFSQVETFIASGNVSFDAAATNLPALEQQIETYLNEALGYAVKTYLRTPTVLAELASYQPFPQAGLEPPAHARYIGFLQSTPTPEAIQKLLAFNNPLNQFHVHGQELYWLCCTPISQSDISGPRLEKALGLPTTLRNQTTINKLVGKYSPK